MRSLALTLMLVGILVFFSMAVNAQTDQFVGNFVATDPNTNGITRLTVSEGQIHIWGRCHPRDCDWGSAPMDLYAPNVGANLQDSARATSAVFRPCFAIKIVIVRPMSENRLKVEVFTKFTDQSRRTDFASKEILIREDMALKP